MWRTARRSTVKLSFETQNRLIGPDQTVLPIVRLMATVMLRQANGEWTPEQDAIIDTGAYCSVAPQYLWSTCAVDIIEPDAKIIGFATDEVCQIPASWFTK